VTKQKFGTASMGIGIGNKLIVISGHLLKVLVVVTGKEMLSQGSDDVIRRKMSSLGTQAARLLAL
jgi:hypothetical protein